MRPGTTLWLVIGYGEILGNNALLIFVVRHNNALLIFVVRHKALLDSGGSSLADGFLTTPLLGVVDDARWCSFLT